MSWTEPQSRGGGAVVLGIVNGRRRHSPDRSFRIGVTTTKNRKAKGSNIAGDNHLDGFSARRSRLHRRNLAGLPLSAAIGVRFPATCANESQPGIDGWLGALGQFVTD